MQKTSLKTLMVIVCMLISAITQAQLFTPITDAAAGLSTEEMDKLIELRSNPHYESLTMVEVGDVFALQTNGILPVNLPGHPEMYAINYNVENPSKSSSPEQFIWQGNFFEFFTNEADEEEIRYNGSIQLSFENGVLFGTINAFDTDDRYMLSAFGPGKNVLIKYAAGEEGPICGAANEEGVFQLKPASDECKRDVKILILTTEGGRRAVPDISYEITHTMNLLNGAVYNTTNHAGGINFVLAGRYDLSNSQFQEHQNIKSTYNLLISSAQVQYLRNFYKADIVVCLVGDPANSDEAGFADPNSTEATAYAVVEADQANENFAFVHEVAHVFGARHQQQNLSLYLTDYDDTPGEDHGYYMGRNKFLGIFVDRYPTIMHSQFGDRQHCFSSPDYKIHKKAMGVAGSNDVMKAMLDRVCTVAEYRGEEEAPRFTTGIVTNKKFYNYGETVIATPRLYHQNGIVVNDWWISTDGGNNYTQLYTTNDYMPVSFTMPTAGSVIIWKKSTDGANQDDTKVALIYDNLEWGAPNCCFYDQVAPKPAGIADNAAGQKSLYLNTYPNPAKEEVTIEVHSANTTANNAGARLIIMNVMGQIVTETNIIDATKPLTMGLKDIAAGTYYIKYTDGTFTTTKKLVITK